jgi:hypothetical protein
VGNDVGTLHEEIKHLMKFSFIRVYRYTTKFPLGYMKIMVVFE